MEVSIIYLPSAMLLGALHAMEPGHAKTLTAAYLIGTKGTKRDAVILGLSVAFTHSLVVILIAALGVWLGQEMFTDRAIYWLQIASGGIVIALGSYLLYRRWPSKVRGQPHEHGPHHHHAPDPFHFSGEMASGTLAIGDTPEGERFRLEISSSKSVSGATVRILRPHNVVEEFVLVRLSEGVWASGAAPDEPHDFDGLLEVQVDGRRQELVFRMAEPKDHEHHANGGGIMQRSAG